MPAAEKRTGDKVAIEGSYQHRALYQGPQVQRHWHRLKLQAATQAAAIGTGARVWDVGCGSGTLIDFLPNGQHTYTGVDANPDALAFCRHHYAAPHRHFTQSTFEALGLLPAASATHIFFLETIEHITRPQGQAMLGVFYHLLAPGGRLVLTTPNRRSAWPLIEKVLDLLRLTPRLAGEQHEYLYTLAELRNMGVLAGYRIAAAHTFNGIAPWLAWLGPTVVDAMHRWEMKNPWLPGSLILMVLEKAPADP